MAQKGLKQCAETEMCKYVADERAKILDQTAHQIRRISSDSW